MDDLIITAKSVPEGRWILEDLVELTDWARIKFKPEMSRSVVLGKGIHSGPVPIQDQNHHNPSGPRETSEELGKVV